MKRTIKRLSRKEFDSLDKSIFGNPLSGAEQRQVYLRRLQRATAILYEGLSHLGLVLVRMGRYILPSGEQVSLIRWDEDNQEWQPLLDYDHLNRVWDTGIALLRPNDDNNTLVKMYDRGEIFPVG